MYLMKIFFLIVISKMEMRGLIYAILILENPLFVFYFTLVTYRNQKKMVIISEGFEKMIIILKYLFIEKI
ncbi:MAG: hypothetical protein CMG74_10065 [Candidatus Marinimicrobia bacterium]|nr:hypothetical protein [Candidatus Neomarinimicrobiota bacterium]